MRTLILGCTRDQFQCANGDCIRADQRCNGYIECADGSDEPEECGEYIQRDSQDVISSVINQSNGKKFHIARAPNGNIYNSM